ncbi:hypothetical protein WMY93_008054 [Mugilogobius chulae]|uniref:BTB domain-containing protein n=1 Tax=Mugilogobius chulae TaxID=88201 RepID=A0AAW0PET3_9GOBI
MADPMMVMEELRRNESLCDAVVHVQDSQFKVHKLVLCGCSPFFKALFTTWSLEDKPYTIPNLTADIMQAFIQFAYTGVVNLTNSNVEELFVAADRFNVAGIVQACCKFMEESLSPQTCLNVWWLLNNFHYPELKQKVFFYILRHFQEVVASPNFLQLSVENLISFIESDHLNVRHESQVFEAILLWISHSHQDRHIYIKDLLPKVRLAFVDCLYFSNNVIGNELIRQHRRCKDYLIKTMSQLLDTRSRGLPIRPSSPLYNLNRPRVPQTVLMAIGGWNITHPTMAIELYDNRLKRWTYIDNGDNTPRAYHGTVFLNNFVYVIGGFEGTEPFCTMHKYDMVNHTWTEAANMHTPRCYVSVTLLDGFIYAMGGFDGNDRLDTAEKYEPETNQWTMIASMIEQRSDASCDSLNGKIYICGGFDGFHCLSSAECYNPLSNQWTLFTPMSTPRSGISVVAHAGEIYVVGGFDGEVRLNTMEAYNPETRQWRSLSSMFIARSNFGIAVLDDEIYAVGGFNGYITICDVEKFDTRTGLWSVVDDLLVPRSALSTCVLHDLPNMADYSAHGAGHAQAPNED